MRFSCVQSLMSANEKTKPRTLRKHLNVYTLCRPTLKLSTIKPKRIALHTKKVLSAGADSSTDINIEQVNPASIELLSQHTFVQHLKFHKNISAVFTHG